MAYLVVDEDGDEWISKHMPIRVEGKVIYDEFGREEYLPGFWTDYNDLESIIQLPWGSILKLIGEKLSFEDEPRRFD